MECVALTKTILQNVSSVFLNSIKKMNNRTTLATFTFPGLITPVFTPFKDDACRTINVDVIPCYSDYCHKNGISGILVNGTTGEGMSMNMKERKLVTEVWAQHCKPKKQHLMVQVGGTCLPDVIELAEHAEKIGADSILCLPNLYHRPAAPSDLIQYLQIVSKAAPSTPLLYYHIPMITNVNIDMGTFLNAIGNTIPTFTGIKFTSTVLDEGLAALKADCEKYCVFMGYHAVVAGAYALGFSLAILTTQNMFSRFGEIILKAVQEGKLSEAQKTQNNLNTAFNVINKYGPWVPTTKAAMQILSSVTLGPPREPFRALTKSEINEMKKDLKCLPFLQ